MKKVVIIVVFVLLVLSNLTYAQEVWVGKDGSIRNADSRGMLIDRGEFYLATKNEVYRAKDINGRWESIFFLPSGNNEINCIGGTSKNVFVGTRRGLFRSIDYGKTWNNVFRTIIPDKNNILAVEVSRYDPKKVVIGTKSGIYASEDSGLKWQDITGNIRNKSIKCISINKELIYAGGDSGFYVREDSSSSWERLLVRSVTEKDDEEEAKEERSEEGERDLSVNCIAIKNSRIYIGVDRKILFSDTGGRSWISFPSEGLSGVINHILPSSKSERLYCATTKGVYEYSKDKSRWFELYKGMEKSLDVNNIIFDSEDENSLWALTDKGFYRLEGGKYIMDERIDVERNLKDLKVVFDSEPTFQELQGAAIRFAEVSPDKIKKWRNEARLKALVPKISLGIDKDSSTNSEIYTSATKDYIVMGPEDISNKLGFSVSWELGDLIWSSDQTNIDVRSRLMVQLRNDILDDLRRAYYERKRLQFELMTEPPKDLKNRIEKEFRLEELTSTIDDLTGNFLSERIRSSKSQDLIDRL